MGFKTPDLFKAKALLDGWAEAGHYWHARYFRIGDKGV
jgi:hypothetical protein